MTRDEVASEHARLREGGARECAERSPSRTLRDARGHHDCRRAARNVRDAETRRTAAPRRTQHVETRHRFALALRARRAVVDAECVRCH